LTSGRRARCAGHLCPVGPAVRANPQRPNSSAAPAPDQTQTLHSPTAGSNPVSETGTAPARSRSS